MAISPNNGAITIIASGVNYQIRPAPLFSLAVQHNRNKIAYLGSTYNINLNGYIVDGLTAISGENTSPTGNEYAFGSTQNPVSGLQYILTGQKNITKLFSQPNLTLEITNVESDNPVLTFQNLQVDNINFEEGQNFNVSRYNISLTTNICSGIGMPDPKILTYSSGISMEGYDLEDFNETWSIDVNDSFGFESSGTYLLNTPRSYTATRNISATSRTIFNTTQSGIAPWQNARNAINYYLSGINDFDHFNNALILPSSTYIGYNHSRTENTDKSAGSYAITDSWFVGRSGDSALENYTMSINSSRDNPYVKIAINGTVKGLSTWSASSSGQYHVASGGPDSSYNQALKYYYKISNSGLYGPTSKILGRIQSAATHKINPQPLSVSLGTNEINGEITYSLDFDNRPLNYFSGVMLESININDTYPGDVFATIPVLGRPTGPILQFTFGRTEYKRDLSIEILLDYSDIGYNQDRAALILRKPSINEPIRSQLNELIRLVSPGQEIGIRKYFLANPPTESWNPKDGRYTLSLGWVYELSE
jgi:hypothetical protein